MRKILFIIVIFLVFFVVLNKVAKSFLQQTKYEKNDFNQNLKLVYGKEYEDYIKVYQQQREPVLYTPLLEFREKKRNHEFVSVGKYGNRCNKYEISQCKEPKGGENEIWIFGGSTVFGYGLKNNETISAHLEKYITNKNVINFGQGYYHSTQSRILFQNLLVFLPPPETVIFFDGYNDFKVNQINNYQFPIQTSLTQRFEKLINKKEISKITRLKNWFNQRFNRLNIVRLYKEKTSQANLKKKNVLLINDPEKAYKSLINRLMINFKINKSIGKNFNIKVMNILEPISLSKENYSTSNLPKSYLNDYNKSFYHHKKIYKLIEFKTELLNIVDLNMVNFKTKKNMFIDLTHYSSNFSDKIASQIFEYLN